MPPLPTLSGREVVKAFKSGGWQVARQRGSHIIMVKEGHMATLRCRITERSPKELCEVIRASGLTVEQFADLTNKQSTLIANLHHTQIDWVARTVVRNVNT